MSLHIVDCKEVWAQTFFHATLVSAQTAGAPVLLLLERR
jgi:hypothetical protein